MDTLIVLKSNTQSLSLVLINTESELQNSLQTTILHTCHRHREENNLKEYESKIDSDSLAKRIKDGLSPANLLLKHPQISPKIALLWKTLTEAQNYEFTIYFSSKTLRS